MPWQLARSDRRRKAEPRPLVELTPHIDIHDLCRWKVFPNDCYSQHILEMSFKYPFLKSLVISRQNIEFNHISGYNQHVALHWVHTYFGHGRPIFVCPQCRCGARRLFLRYGHLACRHCHKTLYASQKNNQIARKRLAASKLRLTLGGWPNIEGPPPPKPKWQHHRTYIKARRQLDNLEAIANAQRYEKPLSTKIFAYHATYVIT